MDSNGDISPPRRFIYNDVDMAAFQESTTKKELLRLVLAMGKSCAMPTSDDLGATQLFRDLSPAMASLHGSLCQMETWLTDIPPDQSAHARFGNPSFRKWHARLVARSESIVSCLLQCHSTHSPAEVYSIQVLEDCSQLGYEAASKGSLQTTENQVVIQELAAYLRDAFGHPIRLDYGTGHESSFMVFLYSLCKLGTFGNPPDQPPSKTRLRAVCLSIFTQYLRVTRGLQTDYMLEPAGSHGVWGLDDYHCLPFYFGACQLEATEDVAPSAIHDTMVMQRYADKYLYFGCIQYIRDLKKGVPFFESSPMLNDISHLPSWSKVSNGLLKLYEGEVLNKRQVVQHFVFGNIFKATWIPSQQPPEAPTENFRSVPSSPGPMPPPTRAPWAK